ncbi:S-methyl-5'-thioadenosine phosphorylase [Psychrobacter sp. AOP22-C1-22]|uniref:S-methyl-5'-thioadenosine phosphorylase n=1 Tax=unclassified Psychrobacter TaxID=196806 RepID=UPI00178844CE|nr:MULTISPECIES: S-methyl-5'-thioadenosine phosphorylase [unclassified Psychrobacter]MBE0405545.1 S-methyl-5'-thioadenosine phosphorylase [Psychrobacter sp. FME6]MBE0445649.1 S-methyl-5'-thioadenosine phosphorylase [Psychrobacter sp. FME5]
MISTVVEDTEHLSADIAIIGGSGLYQMEALTNKRNVKVSTPYGMPSDDIVLGDLDGVSVAFLTRHGQGHKLTPSEVPYRANIYALKNLGVRYIISVSAVGSLREQLKPLDMVVPDQMIDMTKHRATTFFGDGAVAHVSMADPLCPAVGKILQRAYDKATINEGNCHATATYICIEGPQFSTRAESHWYRQMQADIIGMTNMPEAKLAREASIAYATLALVTDFDCWHPTEEAVSADYAIQNLMKNAKNAQQVIKHAVTLLAVEQPKSIAHNALAQALVTPIDAMSDEVKTRLAALLP